jgi:predicted sugar kinase
VACDRRARCARAGLSGDAEREAIAKPAALPQAAAADISQLLMRVLAGAADDDFAAFAAGLNRVQQLLGDHFAPAQGGSAWTSAAVARLMSFWGEHARGSAALGQAPWGPTGFAIVPSAPRPRAFVEAAHAAGAVDAALELARGRRTHHGALVGERG